MSGLLIVPFEAKHLLDLQLQMGQRGIAPFMTEEYAQFLEGQYAFTGMVDGQPIIVAGVTHLWENRAVVWALVDQRAGRHLVAIHKAVKQVLDAVPYRRLEADTPCEFPEGHRWLKMLGFKLEAERMVAYRVDGGDSSLYARVK